jgi:hypothetical protein
MRPLVLIMVFALSCGLNAAQSPFSGTWKRNPAKATISAPSPRSETIHAEANDNGIELTSEAVDPRTGQLTKSGYKAKVDGKEYAVTGDPRVDSIALQRIDVSTLKATTKKAGKVISEYTAIVSTDGRTIKVNYTEMDAQGNLYKGSEVYEKQ